MIIVPPVKVFNLVPQLAPTCAFTVNSTGITVEIAGMVALSTAAQHNARHNGTLIGR